MKNRKNNEFRLRNEFLGKAPIDQKRLLRQDRGEGFKGVGVRHPLHLARLKKKERKLKYAQDQAIRAEILLTEEQGFLESEGPKTKSINQDVIAQNVDITSATKIFNLDLDFGPYTAKYTRNGRHLLLGGRKGHVAAFDWLTKKLHCEMNVMESIHDISWLHLETMFAVAQKEWLYIYDNMGIELHCVKKIDKILKLEFLPYHFLLAAVNEYGFMTWLDISIGEIVGHYNNHLGRTIAMCQNPYNATVCLGDSKGVVSLWAPTVKHPLAKILCHKSPVTAVAVDNRGVLGDATLNFVNKTVFLGITIDSKLQWGPHVVGFAGKLSLAVFAIRYMATTGVDRSMKIWDIRSLDGPLQDYRMKTAGQELHFSQKEMLAVGFGNIVEIYNDCCSQSVTSPYMRHIMSKNVHNFKFCPYEDILGIGTAKGFTSIIIPGSGEPNFDALESNPFQTKSQRKESEVKALLEKIPPELITLNPFEITEVDVPTLKERMEAKQKLLHIKPKNIDLTPRKKKKGKTNTARKKIIKEVARKELIAQSIEAKKEMEPEYKNVRHEKSFGVLNRFVSKNK